MRRVVIDTNVLVAALIHPGGFCGRLLDLVVDGAVEVCIDNRILAEYVEVLSRRKFHLPPDKIQTTLDFFRQSSTPVIAHPLGVVLPDPDDLPFLEVAASGQAILVTGNLRHFPKTATGTVRVLSPAAWLESLQAHP
jgi:putative PIN family toxin of toxin-antitoxin system